MLETKRLLRAFFLRSLLSSCLAFRLAPCLAAARPPIQLTLLSLTTVFKPFTPSVAAAVLLLSGA